MSGVDHFLDLRDLREHLAPFYSPMGRQKRAAPSSATTAGQGPTREMPPAFRARYARRRVRQAFPATFVRVPNMGYAQMELTNAYPTDRSLYGAAPPKFQGGTERVVSCLTGYYRTDMPYRMCER